LLKKLILFLSKLILAYILIGLISYLSGTIYNLWIGKDIVFSPIIGLPLTLLGWPMMLYAVFIHRDALGIKPSSIFTLVAVGIILVFFLRDAINQHAKKSDPSG